MPDNFHLCLLRDRVATLKYLISSVDVSREALKGPFNSLDELIAARRRAELMGVAMDDQAEAMIRDMGSAC